MLKYNSKLAPSMTHVPTSFLQDPRSKAAFPRQFGGIKRVTKPYVSDPGAIFIDYTNSKEGRPFWSVDKKLRSDINVIERELSDTYKPESIHGFSTNGITSDFTAMNSVTGVKSIPANAPTIDADALIRSKDLAQGFETARHKQISDLLWDCMFSRLEMNSASISRISSSTIPFFTSSVPVKQHYLQQILANLDEVLDLISKDKMLELQKKYGVAIAYVLGERHQPDGGKWENGVFTGKPRYAMTRSGMSKANKFIPGEPILVDKHSHLEEVYGLKNCAAMRVRTVYGLSGFITYLMSCLLQMARKVYFKEYEYTWKHTTREQIYDKIKGMAWCVGLDVTQMDQHVPSWFLDRYADKWADHIDPRLAKVFRLMNTAPYFCPQLSPGETPFWVGNPYDKNGFWPRPGLASGRPDVPDLGKFWMTFVYCCMIDDINHDLLEQKLTPRASLDHFLKGGYRIKLLDMGDDAVVGGSADDTAFEKELDKRISNKTATRYAILDREDIVAFLGNVFRMDALTKEIIMPEPNPVSLLVNRFAREHSVSNPNHSEFWGAGLILALEHYGTSSKANEVWKHMEDMWRTLRPTDPTPTMMAKAHAKIKPVGGIAGVSDADIQVLLDPSKLQYKFTSEMISPQIRDKFTTEVPAELIFSSFRNFCTIH